MSVRARISLASVNLDLISKKFLGKNSAIFELRDECIGLLRSVDLLKMRKFNARHVGVHPKNRYGDGIIPSHVTKLAAVFALKGFSIEELGIPRATELPPAGHPRRLVFEAFMANIVNKSDGVLPPYDPNEMEIVSGQRSHTNQSCRLWIKGAPCDGNDKLSVNGKYAISKLASLRPSYNEACQEGLPWEVIPWEVEDDFPMIMDLIQEGGNAALTAAQRETKLEMCLKIEMQFARMSDGKILSQEDNKKVWDTIIADAVATDTDFADEIPDLAEFVQATDPKQLLELVDFQKSILHAPRTISASLMQQIMTIPLGEDGKGFQEVRMEHITNKCIDTT